MRAMKRNMAFKGEVKRKNSGLKEGSPPKKPFKFCSAAICNNANSLPECQKAAFLTFRKFLDPLLYYATKGSSIPLKCKKA